MSIGQQYKLINGCSDDNKHKKKKVFEYKSLVMWVFSEISSCTVNIASHFLRRKDGILENIKM